MSPFPYTFPIEFGVNPSCVVLIDGDLPQILRGSLSIDKRIEERSTASFTLVDAAGTESYARGQPVYIYDLEDNLIFAGFIDNPGKTRMAPGSGLLHEISCMDNHYLADKRLVIRSYANQTAGYIVNELLTDYLAGEGITAGEIQDGPTIQSAVFNYVKASEALDALKELSGFTWYIDENKDLYFVDRSTYTAPWQLDWVNHRALKGSSHLSTGNPLYRNRQYIRGGKGLTSLQTLHFTGDGVLQSFILGYPLALEPTITEDAAAMTVGIKGIETGFDYYWNKGDNSIYADTAPGVGVDVEVQYYGQYPLITLSVDAAGQVARQAIEGGTGYVEDIVTESQHETAEAVQESASAKLTVYCQEAEKFTYQTHTSGLAPGQLQEITYAPFGFAAHEMLIESIHITAEGGLVTCDVSCVTGPTMGSWAKFFSNILTRQDKTLQVGDSLLLALLEQAETVAIAESDNIETDDFSGGIVNRWIALPPTQGAGHNVEHELVAIAETPNLVDHDTEDYEWDDGCEWDFATWA
ncbi:MAG: hypothetical protein PHU08_00290 [Dehalococcoidales bacterium]|nr:hypothetical protein [Dehalococcoidales bacterium]